MRRPRTKSSKTAKWIKIAIYVILALLVVRSELINVGILPGGTDRDYSVVEEYADKPYIEMNGNKPEFEELTTKCFEEYSKLDSLGRCGVACALTCMCTTHNLESKSIMRPEIADLQKTIKKIRNKNYDIPITCNYV